MNTHDRVVKTGLLAGPTDPETQRLWPAWAAEHVVACAECQLLFQLFPVLDEKYKSDTPIPPAPTIAELQARPRRPLLSPEELACDLPCFPADVARADAGLSLTRTAHGARASDPMAQDLLVYAVFEHHAELLGRSAPGAGRVVVKVRLDTVARLVALGFAGEAEPALWQMWLTDWNRRGRPIPLASGARVHAAEIANISCITSERPPPSVRH